MIVLRHAVAVGIHAAELPLRGGLALLGRILQRGQRFGFFVACGRSGVAQAVVRRQRRGIRCGRAVEGEGRRDRKPKHRAAHSAEAEASGDAQRRSTSATPCRQLRCALCARYPHSTPSRPRRPDGSRRRCAPIRPAGRISTNSRRCIPRRAASIPWRAPSSSASLSLTSSVPFSASSSMMSPSRSSPIGPPTAASGPTWPTQKPRVAPEKRPSVISATLPPMP